MNWRKVKLGEILTDRKDRFKPDNKTISDLKRIDKIDFSGNIFLSDKPSNTDMILVKKGDLVISGINVEKGAMSVYQGEEDIIATIHYSSYEFDKQKIDIEFLKLFLKSSTFKQALKEQVPGGIKTEIKPKHLLPLTVEFPTTLREQQAIVEDLIHKFSQLDDLSSAHSSQLDLIKKIRKQILSDAMRGKLAPQNPDDEPASELLKRIKTEKTKLGKKEKPLPEIKPEEIPFEIPENWTWCRLGEVCIVNPRNKADDETDSGFSPMPLIYSEYNRNLDFEIKKWKQIKSGFTHFADNDVIVAKITPCFQNSKAAVVKGLPNKIGAGSTELYTFRALNNIVPEYIYAFVKNPDLLKEGERIMRGVAGQQRVPRDFFENKLIPLPPLSEQQCIVSKIDELMELCDALEVNVRNNQEYVQMLYKEVLREGLQSNTGTKPI